MRRRDFIKAIAASTAARPLILHAAQSDRIRQVGVLLADAENDLEAQAHIAALKEELQKLGWTEGRNIQIFCSVES